MRTKEFLSQIEHDRIIEAIREAEAKTSGEIRVFVQRGKSNVEPVIAAQKKFQQLGMQQTRDRNAVLIWVAPRARKFAVIGDQAIHEKCGDAYWRGVVELMREHFRNEQFSKAILEAIREIGAVLSRHFPSTATSTNELPDDVIEG